MDAPAAVDWEGVDTVLLDMDGTLLDLRFDNWFWLTFVPSRYAAAQGISDAEAHRRLAPKFKAVAHTLQWYCIDYWSRELELDIPALKRETLPRVGFLPGAEAFLRKLRRSGKRVVLVTNSHPMTLAIKNERARIDAVLRCLLFLAALRSAEGGCRVLAAAGGPRGILEAANAVHRRQPEVLQCAREYGIAHLRAVRRPDSGAPPQATADFAAIDGVAELL